ncbi:unnamed protein product [Paramecium pentaurelia]|uniref:Uncharacterized protein n=1 Tax=Paramecium pentaurelia TaxID=43138 RepID=A0A8S1TH73_9CILI|nr:unnamed protein product [Paramecium pentaurelia]
MTNLDFRLINQNTGKKYDYSVLEKIANHFEDKFLNLQVLNGFNSKKRSYECPHCQIDYKEVLDFVPHDLYIRIKKDFYTLADKFSVLNGILLTYIKRNKKDSVTLQFQLKFNIKQNVYKQRIMKIN